MNLYWAASLLKFIEDNSKQDFDKLVEFVELCEKVKNGKA